MMKSRGEVGNQPPLRLRRDIGWLRLLVIMGGVMIGLIPIITIAALKTPHITLEQVLHKVTSDPKDKIPVNSLQTIGSTRAAGPLRVHPDNPRYFSDDSGRAILLTGSHTWYNFQDGGTSDPPPTFDYTTYLDFLEAHNHNFFRLWVWEQSRWSVGTTGDWWINTLPYERSGKETALDGKPKYDLMTFNQGYFDRLRLRVLLAAQRGMYVSIMLFDGWSIEDKDKNKGNPWPGHPFNRENNINGIDGDPNMDGEGKEIHTLMDPAITGLQKAYVEKVIDTVNDLDNVLFEISNESHQDSQDWQYYMINYIKIYETSLPKQHPVGMTVEFPNGSNSELFDSPADWISPNNYADPPPADGSKVIISDSDHIWGIGGDRMWVWKSFTRGINTIFMDSYDCTAEWVKDDCDPSNPIWVSLRENMGYVYNYANHINLVDMIPHGKLTSTGYALANPATSGAEYLIYSPLGGEMMVDLSAVSGIMRVEWFNPDKGTTTDGGTTNGGSKRSFTAPFNGDAVLYICQESSPPPPPGSNYIYQESSPPPPPGSNYIYLPGVFSSRKNTDCFFNSN